LENSQKFYIPELIEGVFKMEIKEQGRFGVSIKGIIELNGKLLLRKNERHEYEFLGGRLEKNDISVASRLFTEFKEESGIEIEILEHREPWLYEIGLKNIVIVPYLCKAVNIPDTLTDEDGGTLHWIRKEEINTLFMPQGYIDTVSRQIPHKSYSLPPKTFFKTVSTYTAQTYYVEINVKEQNTERLNMPLPYFHSPRDFISAQLGEEYKDASLTFQAISVIQEQDTVVLHYEIGR